MSPRELCRRFFRTSRQRRRRDAWIFMKSGRVAPRARAYHANRAVRAGQGAVRRAAKDRGWLHTAELQTALENRTGRERMARVRIFIFMKGRYYDARRVLSRARNWNTHEDRKQSSPLANFDRDISMRKHTSIK